MSLLETIKRAGVGAMEASNPVNVLFGNVTKTNPLEVNVHQRLTLSEDFLIVPESLSRLEIDLKHSHIAPGGSTDEAFPEPVVIREGLKAGDRVILLRVQGGQQYVILDKVVT